MDGGKYRYKDASGFDLDNQALVFKVQLPKGVKPSQIWTVQAVPKDVTDANVVKHKLAIEPAVLGTCCRCKSASRDQ